MKCSSDIGFMNRMPSFFMGIVSFLLVFELMLTGLGFCGHGHAHMDSLCRACLHHVEVQEEHGHHDHADQDDGCPCEKDRESGTRTDFHCPCLGSFIGEYTSFIIDVYPEYSQFTPQSIQAYEYVWYPRIYHPPRTSV